MRNNSGPKATPIPDFSLPATIERLFPPVSGASTLLVACRREDYSASRLARAVEDADAHLLNLNVTSDIAAVDEVVTEIRIDHRSPLAVVRSLERYGYRIIGIDGETDDFDESNRRSVDEFLRYLDI